MEAVPDFKLSKMMTQVNRKKNRKNLFKTKFKMKKHTKLTIRFGEVIPYEKLGINDDSSKEELRECAQYVMSEITELWGKGHCE